jgi:hypothetical protein
VNQRKVWKIFWENFPGLAEQPDRSRLSSEERTTYSQTALQSWAHRTMFGHCRTEPAQDGKT